MASINYAHKEIISKIVYYGPGVSGKTTNLQHVFKKIPSDTRGELISLATDADRTLYFDFLPVNVGSIQGFATKFQLYTVPGQVYYNATRKLVLRGVDGVVFVADSQNEKMDENIESLQNLKDNLLEYGYDPEEIPLVIQYNKRDLPTAMPIEEMQKILNPNNYPYFESVASSGEGVFKTLKAISKLVLEEIRTKTMGSPNKVKSKPKPKPEPIMAGVGSIGGIQGSASVATAVAPKVSVDPVSVIDIQPDQIQTAASTAVETAEPEALPEVEQSIPEPVVEEPVVEDQTEEPVAQVEVSEPETQPDIEQSIPEPVVEEPVVEDQTEEPVYQILSSKPEVQQTISQTAPEPVAEPEPEVQPEAEHSFPEPVAELPVVEDQLEEPVAEIDSDEPKVLPLIIPDEMATQTDVPKPEAQPMSEHELPDTVAEEPLVETESEQKPGIMEDEETLANVVVSDSQGLPQADEEEPVKDDLEETTERSILREEDIAEYANVNQVEDKEEESSVPETQLESEKSALSDQLEGIIDNFDEDVGAPVEEESKTENKVESPEPVEQDKPSLDNFDAESTDISELNFNSALPLGKPQMAESRKVKDKKGFFLFRMFKKKNKND